MGPGMPNRFDHSALAHDELTLPSGQRKLLAVYMRLGSVRMVVGLTVLSIVLSVAINVGIEFTGDHPTRHLWAAVVTAALIPLIVVPMLATWSVRLVASLATACTRLETVTAVDDLTGLATRRRFFEVAERFGGDVLEDEQFAHGRAGAGGRADYHRPGVSSPMRMQRPWWPQGRC